ncbi:MAG: class B sortase [Bacilli bacterium]
MYFIKLFITGIISTFKGIVSFVKYFFIGLFNIITIFPKYFVLGIMTIFGKKKKEKTSVYNKKLSFAMIGLSLTVYLVCVFLISRWSVQQLKIKYLSQDIINSTEIIENEERNEENDDSNQETNPEPEPETNNGNSTVYYPNDYWDYLSVPFMNVNFDELLAKNPDTVGWIKIDGTKVNYPVVQADDNDYYLSHAFNKSNNIAGWVFADYRVDFENFGKNTIIYGHNMNNKTMFGSVPSMLNSNYLNNSGNNYIKISTPTCNTVWKVFSIYTIEPEVYYLKTNFITESFENFLNTIKGRSIYNFGIDVTPDDKILTLSTCDNTGTKRVAVHAKMINIEYK